MIKLNAEEQEILQSYENDEWVSIANDQIFKKYQQIAHNTFKKDCEINIQISNQDLKAFQKHALVKGIPIQILMSNILHKFISGNLVEN